MSKQEMIEKLIENNNFRKFTENCIYYISNMNCIIVMFHSSNQVSIFNDGDNTINTIETFTLYKKNSWNEIYQKILARWF